MSVPIIWFPLIRDTKNYGVLNATATAVGATADANGKVGGCYSFAGTVNSYITCAAPNLASSSWSLSAWVCPTETTSANSYIVGLNDTTANFTGVLTWYNGYLGVRTGNTTYQGRAVNAGEWHHVCAICDGSSLKCYVDGTSALNRTSYAAPVSATHCYIGMRGGGAGAFPGKIYDARVYDTAITESEVRRLARAMILHYPLDNNGWGVASENMVTNAMLSASPWASAISERGDHSGRYALLTNVGTLYRNTSSGTTSLFPGTTFEENTQYTLSLWYVDDYRTDGKSTSPRFGFKYTDGTSSASNFGHKDVWTKCSVTSTAGKTVDHVYESYGNGGSCYFSEIKLEKGALVTPWLPAYSDIPGYNAARVYDISGNGYHGLINNITFETSSPVHRACSVFNGSSSWVKVESNEWMIQGSPELTINLWAYHTDWTTRPGKLFSCTETGGFNTENGSAGYIRFPVDVYTDAELTTRAYKYSSKELKTSDMTPGWHMFTFIVTPTGNAVYLDGNIHSTYSFTHYGLHFNRNARLYIGCEANTANPTSPYFAGKVSDFRLYATVLSPDDVMELYKAGSGVT